MRIVIDARMYFESGIGRYVRNLLTNLQKLDNKNEYFVLHPIAQYDRLVYRTNFQKVLADFKWYGVKEQIELPKILNKLKPDIVHFPHFNISLAYGGKFVVTIHDLIHQHYSMSRATTLGPITYKIKQLGYKNIFKKAITKSEKILVPSKYVRDLLVGEWNVNPEKVVVTYEAVDDKMFTIVKKMNILESSSILKKFGIHQPYIFYIGNAHPHKNIDGLIKAFLALKENYKDLQLVLSGNDNYFWQKIKNENNNKNIFFTGLVTDEELVSLYKNAEAFVMPSFEEGFGIPILEAMAIGCPVVSSNAGALPEVGEDAAIYFDPKSPDDMESKISMVLEDESLIKDLILKGVKRVKNFSWEKLAKQTLEVYKRCALQ